MHSWEAIHGTIYVCAGDLLHFIKGLAQKFGSLFETIEDLRSLCFVLVDALGGLTPNVRWVHHQVNGQLADGVRAQLNAFQLIQHLFSSIR